MPALYEMADICVLPSIWDDPAPLAVIESLISGKPLITTRSGGIPEYANDDCAIILERNSKLVEHLTQAMVELANDPAERIQMEKNKNNYCKELGSSSYMQQYIQLMMRR